MGRSQVDKQKTHERIVEIAAERLREKGLDGIGVADLMKEAGLTVGGFYKHFASRDELLAEAVESAFGDWRRGVEKTGRKAEDISLPDFVDTYLGETHRDNPGKGCPLTALSCDIARSNPAVRSVGQAGLERNLAAMTKRMAAGDPERARADAIVAASLMAGAISLSRLCDDAELADEILARAKEAVLSLPSAPKN